MNDLLIKIKDNIDFFNNDDSLFTLKKPLFHIFDTGKIESLSETKYHISIFNNSLIEDDAVLDKFATFLSETFGPDENNHVFNDSIEDKTIRYSLCFDFDSLYEGKPVTLFLEFWDGKLHLNFLGCENLIPINQFLSNSPK